MHEAPEDRPLLPTEDEFLRLDDMERFVQDAEASAMRENATNDEEDAGDEDEDEEEDLLGSIPCKSSILPDSPLLHSVLGDSLISLWHFLNMNNQGVVAPFRKWQHRSNVGGFKVTP